MLPNHAVENDESRTNFYIIVTKCKFEIILFKFTQNVYFEHIDRPTRKFILKTLENHPFFRLLISIYFKSSSVHLTNPGLWARSSDLTSKSDFKIRIKICILAQ